jgi:hypothetical protein
MPLNYAGARLLARTIVFYIAVIIFLKTEPFGPSKGPFEA